MHSTSSTEMMLAEGFLDHPAYDVESGIQPLITPSGIGAELRWACEPSHNDTPMWNALTAMSNARIQRFCQALRSLMSCALGAVCKALQ